MTEIVMTFLAISWNVGTPNDWQELLARSKINTPFSTEVMSDNQKRSSYNDKISQEKLNLNISSTVIPDHDQKVEVVLNQLIQLNPAVFFLQEFYYAENGVRYKSIFDVLTLNGYIIVMNLDDKGDNQSGVALAFKQDGFDSVTMRASENNEIIVDVKDNKTGTIIRLVSIHLRGFNALVEKRNRFSGNNGSNNSDVRFGDNQLKNSLSTIGIDELRASKKSLFQSLRRVFKPAVQPCAIVYGLDANAIHSDQEQSTGFYAERLKLFDEFGFITGSKRTNTILDANSAEEVCYDFMYGYAHNKLKIELENITTEVNDPYLLSQPHNLASDHLPVITQIKIGK